MLASSILPSPAPLHIPDGLLSPTVSLICWLLAILAVAIALRRSRESLGQRQVPLMGVLAAFVFAAQMLNFTVVGGTSMAPSIEIRNLSFAYPDGREALHGIDLTIHPGEKAALVGPNRAGKSTLLLHLNGLLAGDGAVQVLGQAVRKPLLGSVRAHVGMVFQSPDDQLFSPTVFDDVAYGPLYAGLGEAEIRRRVGWALGQAGMVGYEERVSHHLSLGEKKGVAIATVLSMQPDILALDEPTAGLDTRTRRRLTDLLRELPQTMLVATHDMDLVAEICHRAVILDEGKVVADGPMRKTLMDEGLLRAHGLERPHILTPHVEPHHQAERTHRRPEANDEVGDASLNQLRLLIPAWIAENAERAELLGTWAEEARSTSVDYLVAHIEEALRKVEAASLDLDNLNEELGTGASDHASSRQEHSG